MSGFSFLAFKEQASGTWMALSRTNEWIAVCNPVANWVLNIQYVAISVQGFRKEMDSFDISRPLQEAQSSEHEDWLVDHRDVADKWRVVIWERTGIWLT